ncbi:glycosyltransferase family 2 protein [Isoptericola sp. b408]|uniref:glycosyltransferase family 2 protein n=1 Tax=Isoptericola sp. b408 TaxID=3064653 RepID=UPI00271230E6|nr:glycosyltransferase family 2 protein [Isoptericola sp. b408]MDO8152703.1 glycosyltransferase family 2 protein [Isoptericola sp. b408]
MSVIIPAYNVSRYVEDAVRSVFEQTLAAARIEIIVVDDGSTDDTLTILEKLAAEHPGMRVIAQENSGSASRPRNVALDHATGTYVFCLDADDQLTPWALLELVDTADATDSDVVLGKMQGMGGRGQPSTTFRRTVLDADLARDHLFHAMTPHKLFRRSHIERHGLRFPEDISVGEDVLFVAAAELKARRIAILADRPYYLWRLRDDGGHLSRSGAGFETIFEKSSRLVDLIEEHVTARRTRDALLRRAFRYVYHGMLRSLSFEEDPQVRAVRLDRIRERFGYLWTDGVRAHLEPHLQLPLWLLFAGRDEEALAVAQHVKGDVRRLRYVRDGDELVVNLPADLARSVPLEWRRAGPVVTRSTLVSAGSSSDGGPARMRADVEGRRVRTAPDAVAARLLRTPGGAAVDVQATVVGNDRGTAHVELALPTLEPGTWHIQVTPSWGPVVGQPTKVLGPAGADPGPEDLGSAQTLTVTAGRPVSVRQD